MIAHQPVRSVPYDPWADLAERWPEVSVVLKPMSGTLLGEVRYPVIALRAGTSAAQRRCTLTHELIHLERGVDDCGQWARREELAIEREVADRLVPLPRLIAAVRAQGGAECRPTLAAALDVDLMILQTRLDSLTRAEKRQIRAQLSGDVWSVA
jgi:hypothetical protein